MCALLYTHAISILCAWYSVPRAGSEVTTTSNIPDCLVWLATYGFPRTMYDNLSSLKV